MTQTVSPTRAWKPGDRVHPLLEAREDFRAVADALDEAARAPERLQQAHRAELGRWQSAYTDAALAGEPTPPRPAEPERAGYDDLAAQTRALQASQRTLAAEIGEEVDEDLRARAEEIFEEVNQLMARIGVLAQEMNALGTAAERLEALRRDPSQLGSSRVNVTSTNTDTLIRHAAARRPLFGVPKAQWQEWRQQGLVR